MRRLLAIAVPVFVSLGVPAVAPAKGIVSAMVCGASGCRSVHPTEQGVLGGGAPTDPPARREPFVRLEVRVGVPDHTEPIRLLYLPRSELLLGDNGQTWVVPMALAELRSIARRVTPFPARELPASAAVGKGAGSAPRAGSAAPATEDPSATAGAVSMQARAAEPRAVPSPRASRSGGLDAWWFALPGAAIVLAAGLLARRRRRGSAASAPAAV